MKNTIKTIDAIITVSLTVLFIYVWSVAYNVIF
jgi:cbb3-type cytochrome oxidase subunit 3